MAKQLFRIGLYGSAHQEIAHRTASGMLRYCQEAGDCVFRDLRLVQLADARQEKPPWQGRVDGVVLNTGKGEDLTDAELADWVLSAEVPAVSVAADWFDPRVPAFYVSRPSLGQLAARHLQECHCRSFLFVGYAGSTGSRLRGAALGETLSKQGHRLIEYETHCAFAGSLEDESLAEQEAGLVANLLRLRKPLGVWALNDDFARAVCRLCEKLKLAVPQVVKVLGVDDTSIARLNRPMLSSIRTPGETIGYRAMRALHKLVLGKKGVPKATAIPATELVARESTLEDFGTSGNLQDALDYIAQHACAGVTIEEVVDLFGMSRRTLETRFQAAVGHSPGQEIQRIRLARAKELLRETQFSVSRIATMIGFRETAAFSKFFRQHAGRAPREFRES